ncbi:Putative ATP-dependent DNA helicase YjcD [Gimesia alba]|uniref:DNA 3'-5' helicase n=1 Tax=Gimesia alba TaxID=2527973 RepID=A0A517RB85_9PLAN|nr:ATP-dependent helicase [Gimesia alba]QDT41104.1 Putative ATP-dependent DNA helicase YjcD [Gimesia alba]
MPIIAQVIGGAGTGKTTYLLGVMDKLIDIGADPMKIGFVSFTKAAVKEAADRAGSRFNVDPGVLSRDGYFKTLHAMCYMLLDVRSETLITDDQKSKKWIAEAIGEKIGNEDESDPFSSHTESGIALMLWHCARNRLEPYEAAWQRASCTDERTPSYSFCRSVVEKYEHYKVLDNKVDFTDLLGSYAGYKFRIDGVEQRPPRGDVPQVDAWFLDECQDNSALSDAVARRLSQKSKYVYLVADPFQAIYGWSGASPGHFMNWDVLPKNKQILQQTYRCPSPIIRLGEGILKGCSDYWDRGIKPAEHSGSVENDIFNGSWISSVRPDQSWLLIARTNFQANRIGKRLDALNIPWRNSGKGNNKWNAPVRHKTILALLALERGQAITGDEWLSILKNIRSRNGKVYFSRGTKKEWEQKDVSGMLTDLEHIADWGGTADFVKLVKTHAWRTRIEGTSEYMEALDQWGYAATAEPQVKVGTVHSVKGAEADNVVLLTSISHQILRGQDSQGGFDEERRVEYVAVTRAKERLIICNERNSVKKGMAMMHGMDY